MSRFKLLPFYCFLFTSLLGKDDSLDFAREVLPILSNKCYACHGPDTKEEKLVRLDLENLAKKDLGGYHAIDPSDLEESELLFRIVDEDDPMPPEDFRYGVPLTGTRCRLADEVSQRSRAEAPPGCCLGLCATLFSSSVYMSFASLLLLADTTLPTWMLSSPDPV